MRFVACVLLFLLASASARADDDRIDEEATSALVTSDDGDRVVAVAPTSSQTFAPFHELLGCPPCQDRDPEMGIIPEESRDPEIAVAVSACAAHGRKASQPLIAMTWADSQ